MLQGLLKARRSQETESIERMVRRVVQRGFRVVEYSAGANTAAWIPVEIEMI